MLYPVAVSQIVYVLSIELPAGQFTQLHSGVKYLVINLYLCLL